MPDSKNNFKGIFLDVEIPWHTEDEDEDNDKGENRPTDLKGSTTNEPS